MRCLSEKNQHVIAFGRNPMSTKQHYSNNNNIAAKAMEWWLCFGSKLLAVPCINGHNSEDELWMFFFFASFCFQIGFVIWWFLLFIDCFLFLLSSLEWLVWVLLFLFILKMILDCLRWSGTDWLFCCLRWVISLFFFLIIGH